MGYAWLGIGLGSFGIALATDWHVTGALHVITIGALGTLTSGIMSRTRYQRLYRTPPPARLVVWMLSTITLATLARVAATFFTSALSMPLLWIAATAWTLCFGLLACLFTAERFRGGRETCRHAS